MTDPAGARPTVVVTGAGRGLGEAMARRAAADGYRVVVAELNEAWGARTAAAIRDAGGAADFVPLDVADPASVEALAARVAPGGPAYGGPVYGLVNNAALANGVGGREFQDLDVETWDRLMTVNARGPWLVAKHLLPLMPDPGRIVNIASDAALYGSPRLAHYIASKGAVLALTRAMARELGERGITVNAVAPGLTEVEATGTVPAERHALYAANRAIRRPQQPDDLVGLVSFLLGEESRYLTGQVVAVNGGFTMH
ncbi:MULTISPECIES: SDR family oxidoreductase [Streptomyces]|uniref:SDR family oxidoreductase n=1 Tax=Streptomyces coelicoflavus TaxID=285562 RepID=A0A6N9UM48_9ACTN|nr:SDR family oxidoreductase [Streptomyces sp. CS159]EHN73030.1 3-ketoacyl-(acyl-carrier-protein) reductase [Streptomyces coelicoflavus ZG0656]MZE48953.1 SDR family oxidoreductase [Streptomyces sp. SID5477]NEB18755.1 SDR family oxidoreductase [Streptomyces coelicoflavus]OWA10316.1 short-chain dehydrogenase [Streptomyces sp. CS159]